MTTVTVIEDQPLVLIGVGEHLAPSNALSHAPSNAACNTVLTEAALQIQLHPSGTAIKWGWEPALAAIEACHQAAAAQTMGCSRFQSPVAFGNPTGKDRALANKLAGQQALL